eukprot:13089848-Alexandrium_andersonii.AAC.1
MRQCVCASARLCVCCASVCLCGCAHARASCPLRGSSPRWTNRWCRKDALRILFCNMVDVVAAVTDTTADSSRLEGQAQSAVGPLG